ncbi:MAG: retention module-containing protein, partial [Thiobacillus sp.]|nr:retention module-containing protein [Thiobacillus sp.]
MAAVQSQAIAHVSFVKGEAYARAADGSMRALKVGDPIHQGETLITMPEAKLEIAFMDGHRTTILPEDAFQMTPEVAHDYRPDLNQAAVGGAEIDKVIQAIEQGGQLDNLLEETAAGLAAGVGGENGGNNFVRLLRISESVTPLEYQYDASQPAEIQPFEGAAVQTEAGLSYTLKLFAVVDGDYVSANTIYEAGEGLPTSGSYVVLAVDG